MVATYQGKQYHLSGGRWRRKTASGSFLMPIGFTPFQTTQRRTKAKAKARAPVPARPSLEVKHLTLPEQTATLQVLAGSANNGPANSVLCMCQMYDRNSALMLPGVSSSEYVGSWITPQYGINHKLQLTFDDIVQSHADSQQGFNIFAWQLLVKVSGNKADVTTATFADWASSILALCKRELFEANFDADFLEYHQKSKTVQVIKKWRVNTSQDKKYGIAPTSTAETSASPKNITVTHNHPPLNKKQKITPAEDAGKAGLLNDTWIPLVMFTCDQMTANTGSVAIRFGSRFYYTDA